MVDAANVDGSWIRRGNSPLSATSAISRVDKDHVKTPENAKLVAKPEKVLHWTKFDVERYLAKGRLKANEDKYEKNKFNQQASDNTAVDRTVPDTREYK